MRIEAIKALIDVVSVQLSKKDYKVFCSYLKQAAY